MDAKDLMIDDWVKCVDSTHTISMFAQVDAIEEGHDCILVKRDISNWFLDIKYLEPIPLTAEILEKNFTQHSRYKYDYCTDYFDLYITEYTDGLWCITVDEIEMGGLPTWKMYVSDVHELQHALRLCRIEKEIEL